MDSSYTSRLFTTAELTVLTSARAMIGGIAFVGTATGGVQLFAGVTASASLTPMISFSATTSAVAGGLSPMFLRLPFAASGSGVIVSIQASADPNIMLFWNPLSG